MTVAEEMAHKEHLAGQEDIQRKEKWERLELAAAKNHQFFSSHNNVYISHVVEQII